MDQGGLWSRQDWTGMAAHDGDFPHYRLGRVSRAVPQPSDPRENSRRELGDPAARSARDSVSVGTWNSELSATPLSPSAPWDWGATTLVARAPRLRAKRAPMWS